MGTIRKLIAGTVGVVLLGLNHFLGWGTGTELFGMDVNGWVQAIISVLTLVGIYQAPNDPSEGPSEPAA